MGQKIRFVCLMGLFFVLWDATPSFAEPWLGNRYAQNCAGCHAPGRKNLVPVQRRCTLACQGCHVSPNGSGLRSHYGKWTEDYWLRSFRSDVLGHQKNFAPTRKQTYGMGKNWRKASKKVIEKGLPIVWINKDEMNEPLYDRRYGLSKIDAGRREFEYQVPDEDPYRYMNNTKIDGGADLRWQMQRINRKIDKNGTVAGTDIYHNWLMSGDIALRWRPVYKRYHVIYEGRFLGYPTTKKYPYNALNQFSRRSFYLYIDDLPYATYVMAGYYRPLFGTFNVDHTTLPQRMISYALQENPFGYNISYEAASVGGSPNVPFANFHLLGRQIGQEENKHKGFAANIGGRFVTLGLSITYSYWRSDKEVADDTVAQLEMHAIGFGGQFGPTTVTFEGTSITKDIENDSFREGGVWSLETYTQFWRQFYAYVAYNQSNIAENLNPGSAREVRLGIRAFLIQGVDGQLSYVNKTITEEKVDDRTEDSVTTDAGILYQLHLYI